MFDESDECGYDLVADIHTLDEAATFRDAISSYEIFLATEAQYQGYAD